ncbi:MAG: BatA domain-containing protein, partial [Holosporaceae bacterium]
MPILPFPSFHQPLWLLPLLLLPLLWWWLRQRDRQPLTVAFPATRLLLNFVNLVPRARPPIWRRVLQLLLLASLMVALAQPYWPSRRPPIANQPTLLVLDNGWLAGQHWGSLQQAAITLLDQLPADQPVYVISTTSLAAPLPPLGQPPIAVDEAKAMIGRWQPNSWPIDPGFAEHLKVQPWWYQLGQVWWLTGSMQDQASKNVMGNLEAALPMGGRLRPLLVGRQQAVLTGLTPLNSLNSLNSLTVPTDTALPANAIKPEGWLVQLNSSGGSQRQELQLVDEDGQLLAQQQVTLVGGAQTIPLLAPTPQLAKASQLRLVGQRHPGAVWLLPVGAGHAGVGLIGEAASLQSRPPLSQAAHYLTQALQPSPPVMADVTALLAEGGGNPIPAMMLWPEDQMLNAEERAALTAWVSRGGVLLRLGVSVDSNDGSYGSLSFGDRAQSNNGVITDALLPGRLLAEPRRFGGLLSPQVQQRVRATANTPVADLPEVELAIQQAWLSLPDVEQASETWLSLPDGSPLLSARPLGQGWLLLLHVPATPNWSDLPMSTLFPQLLQRLAMFAGQQPAVRGMVAMPAHGQSLAGDLATATEALPAPLSVPAPTKTAGLMAWRQLDGYGRLVPAQSHSQALPLDKPTAVTYDHPPGYYGMAGSARPLNPDWQAAGLQILDGEPWQNLAETNLTKPCLLLALALLTLLGLCDAVGRRPRLYSSPPSSPSAPSGAQPLPALSPPKSWRG